MRLLARSALVAVAWLLMPGLVFAQTGTITGTVFDAEIGETLPGATVMLPELDRGTTTDINGQYTFEDVPAGEHEIRVSFVGFADHHAVIELAAGEVLEYDVQLGAAELGLDELVVTGYGVQRRRDVTGSISQVRAEDIQAQPIVSADQALQGRTAGVLVTSTSGEPGGGFNITVRGTGSITAGAEPLYVVDGIPINTQRDIGSQASTNPLAGIRASDIESIEVLKDAAASSIYGAQAANGVVLITTTRGQAGRTQITAETRVGQVTTTQMFDMVNTQEWLELQHEAWGHRAEVEGFVAGGVPYTTYEEGVQYFNQAFLLPEQREMLAQGEPLPTYDWQDAATQVGLLHEHSLRARGGTETTQFYVSGAYDFRQGQFIRSDFDRLSLRANVDNQASDRLSFESNVSLVTQEQQGSVRDGNFINGVLFGAPLVAPNIPVRHEDGQFTDIWRFGNPVAAVTVEDRYTTTRRALANVAATYEFIPNLFLRSNVGADYSLYRDQNHRPGILYYEGNDSGFEATREVINYTVNSVLNYTPQLAGEHNLTGLVGAEYRREFREDHTVSAQNFPSPLFRTINSAADIVGGSGFRTEWRTAGLFSRAQYNFDDRYFATASARYDGSSRFGAENRWGLFYSASLGWDLAQEDFMANVGWLGQLQPRISYGTTGNSQIGNFAARGLYGTSGPYVGQPDLRPTQLANPFLTWEEAATLNVGVDVEMFGGRVFGSLEAFNTINSNLLLDRELPFETGFQEITENVGRVQNRGVEFEVSTINVDAAGFRWSSDFNITAARNEVLELVGDEERFGSGIGYVDPEDEVGTVFVGEPIRVFYAPRYAGVNPADGRAMWFDGDGNITYNPSFDRDAEIVGYPDSDFWGGFNNRFSYAGLTLDVFFQYDFGSDTWEQASMFFYETPQWQGGMLRNQLERWQQPGDITSVPRMHALGRAPGSAEARTSSSRHVRDRSYIRLKNVQLAYRVPPTWAEGIGMEGLTVYLQGQNLITWTAYEGMDPEIFVTARGYFPQPRTVTAGLRLDL